MNPMVTTVRSANVVCEECGAIAVGVPRRLVARLKGEHLAGHGVDPDLVPAALPARSEWAYHHGNDFMFRVADWYRYLVNHDTNPTPEIARQAQVPVTTVHRWIREARERGLLPVARHGARG